MTYAIIAILAIACIISFFFVPAWVFAVFVVIWLAWSLYALLLMNKSAKEDESSNIFAMMKQNDKRRLFSNHIKSFQEQSVWIEERMEVLKGFSESYYSLAENLKEAMYGNFEKANNYMRACDYHNSESMQKYTCKINDLFNENKSILDKLNDLIEQLAEIDNSADNVDTGRVDDIIESLKQMTEGEM